MKKTALIISLASLLLISGGVFAKTIDLNQIVGAVAGSNDTNKDGNGKKNGNLLSGLEDQIMGRVNKIVDRVDERIKKYEDKFDAYEKKIDGYEKKLDQAEAAADKVVSAVNNFEVAKLKTYLDMAKYAAIGFAVIFVLSFVLLVVILIQTFRINTALKHIKSKN